jgi:hypothetical protein
MVEVPTFSGTRIGRDAPKTSPHLCACGTGIADLDAARRTTRRRSAAQRVAREPWNARCSKQAAEVTVQIMTLARHLLCQPL